MHQRQGNCVAIRRAVVHSARAAHIFSAGIKCRHCTYDRKGDYSRNSNTDLVWSEGSESQGSIWQ